MKDVYVILFPNFTALDVFGPVEVLSGTGEYTIRFMSLEGGIVENSQGIRIITEPLSVIKEGNIALVPGGFGTRSEVDHMQFISALKSVVESAENVLCVCTGSALVAKTGALDGRRATSNKTAFEWVRSCGPDVTWVREARWVHDGKFYTSAGVSAGTDMALGFVKDMLGDDRADAVCRRMEYHWNSDPDTDIF